MGSYQVPKEVFEYVSLHKDMVLTFTEYPGVWDWKAFAIATFGAIQITIGALLMAYPILGPWSYSFGSGLIAEGAGDIMYAVQNAGSISAP